MSNPSMQAIPNLVTRTLICVDQTGNSDFSGRFYNPYMPQPVVFCQAKDIIMEMEEFFNGIHYPQSSFEPRSFLDDNSEDLVQESRSLYRYLENEVFEQETGRLATFELQVLYRQAASWQGELLWKERQQRETFRSALELLRMMHRALVEVERLSI